MYKLWITTVVDGRITRSLLADWSITHTEDKALTIALDGACNELDLSRPIIMKKHINEISLFHRTRFLPEHFIENVDFDRMEVEVFESELKVKKIYFLLKNGYRITVSTFS